MSSILVRCIHAVKRKFLPGPQRNYLKDWVSQEGRQYRMMVYKKQRKDGSKPLIANPTFQEVKAALRPHSPSRVLEVGCGWGRLLEAIQDEFHVEGCDISDDMLKLCSQKLKVFKLDIVKADPDYVRQNSNRWDIIFTRGVMLYFMEFPSQMTLALENMAKLANKKVLFWEWTEVCNFMRKISDNNPKFEYHPIEHLQE